MPKYIAAEPGNKPEHLAEFLSRELRRIEHGIPDGRFTFRAYPRANLPPGQVGDTVYCTDGNAGGPCLAVHDGTTWRRVALGLSI